MKRVSFACLAYEGKKKKQTRKKFLTQDEPDHPLEEADPAYRASVSQGWQRAAAHGRSEDARDLLHAAVV